jgi:hypothetical protein
MMDRQLSGLVTLTEREHWISAAAQIRTPFPRNPPELRKGPRRQGDCLRRVRFIGMGKLTEEVRAC